MPQNKHRTYCLVLRSKIHTVTPSLLWIRQAQETGVRFLDINRTVPRTRIFVARPLTHFFRTVTSPRLRASLQHLVGSKYSEKAVSSKRRLLDLVATLPFLDWLLKRIPPAFKYSLSACDQGSWPNSRGSYGHFLLDTWETPDTLF